MLCLGCIYAAFFADNRKLCPFCRTPAHDTDRELIERINNRVKGDDINAICSLGGFYRDGIRGLPQDYEKAMELWHRAGELGCATSYYSISRAYYRGEGVERDMKKAKHYCELAAIGGSVEARHNLGCLKGRQTI